MEEPTIDALPEFGSGPAVLLLHAYPLDHRMWLDDARVLAARWRVLAPDLSGFGSAAREPVSPLTMDAMADRVAAALDARGVQPVAVMGLSMGGYVALALASRRPELVRALVLASTRARADLPAERENRLRLATGCEQAGPGAAAWLATQLMPRLVSSAAPEGVVAQVRSWIGDASPRALAAAQRGMAERPDRSECVRSHGGPLLAIGGAADPITPPDEIHALARMAPRGRAVVLDGAGHLVNLEQPDAFRAAIVEFLDRPS